MTVSSKLAALGVVVAIAAIAAYALLLRVAIVGNHPEGYVVAFALATALAALAVARARARRWPAWLVLGLTSLLLAGGAWFNIGQREIRRPLADSQHRRGVGNACGDEVNGHQ